MPGVVYHQRSELVWVHATPFRPDRWEFDLLGRNRPRQAPLERRHLPTDALPNLSVVRRSGMEAVGGFDEGFPVNSSADLCQRMKSAGRVVQADTGVLTRHYVEPPGTPGYWAEHAVVDPYRARHEVADWFRFPRRWGPAGPGFAARASARALRFLLPTIVAAAIRPVPHRFRLTVSLGQGCGDGLFGPMPASPAPWAASNDGGGRPPESHGEKGVGKVLRTPGTRCCPLATIWKDLSRGGCRFSILAGLFEGRTGRARNAPSSGVPPAYRARCVSGSARTMRGSSPSIAGGRRATALARAA